MNVFKTNLKFLAVIALFGFLFTSCSSDDDNSSNEIDIVGKWFWESVEGDDADDFDQCFTLNYYMFNADGTVKFELYWDEDEIGDCESETMIGLYELVDGNRIKFIDPQGDVEYAKIESYTGNRMVITDEEYPEDIKITLVRD